MASVRLDPELEARLERAAALRGESKSDFIRTAVADRIEATLGTSLADRLAHVIGQVDLGGGLAERAHELAGELMDEDHRAEAERWPQGS
jgi:predicted transcriptional regulator